jgi:NAD-dependent dihydropyrimidine dehydrogenase PreA subunit
MSRKIIAIDVEKCNGCGLCAEACHEGAIGVVDGKAKLLREDYCDGLGNCLPVCPTEAISFEEREAAPYDEAAVRAAQAEAQPAGAASRQRQWPIKIKLVPVNARFFENAHLLIAADCAAFAYGEFHSEYMNNKTTIIGCPKLDGVDYSVKLGEIITKNNIASVTVVKMEVPCCGGIEYMAMNALKNSGKTLPWQVHTLSVDGKEM